ncbi:hypothetical protein [Mycobacterium sp. NPDC050041]|uniref:hypothetical protein n=1 Tax=Mycobacterium sp. NPDC050041 TaxID=3364293 RepID=UPI003C2B817F
MKRQQFKFAVATTVAAVCVPLAGGTATAAPPPSVPGPGEPGYCGAKTSAWNCWFDVSPPNSRETDFIDFRLQYDMPGIPTDRDRLLQIARGICSNLAGGVHPNNIVMWVAEDLGASEEWTGQMFSMAQDMAC